MAKELDDQQKQQEQKRAAELNQALSTSRVKPGKNRMPMASGPKMTPGNKRVPTKKRY